MMSKNLIAICVLVALAGVTAARGKEVVSIWSKGARAYLSVKGKTSLANSPIRIASQSGRRMLLLRMRSG